MSLSGRVAIITGGATGIGFAVAEVLARRRAKIAILQPSLDQAQQSAGCLPASSAAIGVAADVRDSTAVERAFEQIHRYFGQIDVLVHSAALTGPSVLSPLIDCNREHVDEVIDVNLKGSVYCAQAAARRMKPGSAIVLVSSVGALAAQEGAGVYCATKAAISCLARSMALEWASLGIRVNAIAPGDILTKASEDMKNQVRARGLSGRFVRTTPLSRRGSPAEIGEAIAFLLSDQASFITGTTLVADGGLLTY